MPVTFSHQSADEAKLEQRRKRKADRESFKGMKQFFLGKKARMERPKFEMSKSKDLDGIGKGGNFRDSSVKRSDNGTASDRNLVRMIPQDQSFKFDKYGRPMTDSQMQIV